MAEARLQQFREVKLFRFLGVIANRDFLSADELIERRVIWNATKANLPIALPVVPNERISRVVLMELLARFWICDASRQRLKHCRRVKPLHGAGLLMKILTVHNFLQHVA